MLVLNTEDRPYVTTKNKRRLLEYPKWTSILAAHAIFKSWFLPYSGIGRQGKVGTLVGKDLVDAVVQMWNFLSPQYRKWKPQHQTMVAWSNVATKVRTFSVICHNVAEGCASTLDAMLDLFINNGFDIQDTSKALEVVNILQGLPVDFDDQGFAPQCQA
eukprot:g47804.t1